MAYQNVGTPRFYIDSGLYQQAIGVWTPEDDQVSSVQLNPTNIVESPSNDIQVPRISPIRYLAILGHNGGNMYPQWATGIGDDPLTEGIDESVDDVDAFEEVVNMTGSSAYSLDYSGFSIGIFSDNESMTKLTAKLYSPDITIGAISIGNYYDMPHSPDLNLKLSYEYDGVKTIQTKGGATLSNASYTKPADWGDMGAWQLGGVSNLRSGRRVWDLSFSYLSDSDLFGSNQSTSVFNVTAQDYRPIYTSTGYEDTDIHQSDAGSVWGFNYNILNDDSFFSQVWNKTMGGHLPFIFQPDGSNNNPDQFAICRFDMNSLTYDQVANNVYNVKLKIREVW